jgi:hypothetical protein
MQYGLFDFLMSSAYLFVFLGFLFYLFRLFSKGSLVLKNKVFNYLFFSGFAGSLIYSIAYNLWVSLNFPAKITHSTSIIQLYHEFVKSFIFGFMLVTIPFCIFFFIPFGIFGTLVLLLMRGLYGKIPTIILVLLFVILSSLPLVIFPNSSVNHVGGWLPSPPSYLFTVVGIILCIILLWNYKREKIIIKN